MARCCWASSPPDPGWRVGSPTSSCCASALPIRTYPRILLGLIVTDFLLTFIVPSGIARVVIMASIALGLAEAFKSPPGHNVSRGMFLILSYTANIFDKMIIAGAGSITARGLIEKGGGVEVLWSYWFLAFLPCSIITVLAGVLIVGYSYGYFAARDLMIMGAWLTIVEFLVLLVLVPVYWPLIGLQ
ncbi:MAG TPA: anion permease [Xanthobacteraceae bacterium]